MFESFCVHCHKKQPIRIETTVVEKDKLGVEHHWLIGWCAICSKKVRRALPKKESNEQDNS